VYPAWYLDICAEHTVCYDIRREPTWLFSLFEESSKADHPSLLGLSSLTRRDALLIARQKPNKIIDMLYSEPRVIETADSNTQMI